MTDPGEVRAHIANLIRSRRLALRLDQNGLAARSGISQAAISKYEMAAAAMRAEDVPRLAAALEIEPWEFFTGIPRSNMGVNWTAVEAEVLMRFRSLPPGPRMEVAHLVQAQATAYWRSPAAKAVTNWRPPDSKAATDWDSFSIGGSRSAEAEPTSEGSGVVSKNEDAEERETPENVL